ncbi:MAG TPA: alpha/beta hydrolase [Candidatus Saccharimonadales bacterium]|nr:alpha/beta hydrolase [Candidatus Saccharimonadales bacterium]
MNVIVNDLLVNYEITGKGKLLLLLHGWGDSIKGLQSLQSRLAESYKIVAIDMPGFGGSQPPPEAWNLDNYARMTKDILDKLGLDQPYALIGHSNGGAIIIRAVSQELLMPEKIVLLAASGIRENSSRKQIYKSLAKIGKSTTLFLPQQSRKKLRAKLYKVAGSDYLVAPQLEETFKLTVAQDLKADAARVTTDTLLIYSPSDKAVPLSIGEKYNQLMSNSRLELVENASHFIHLDNEAKVVKLIRDFLK